MHLCHGRNWHELYCPDWGSVFHFHRDSYAHYVFGFHTWTDYHADFPDHDTYGFVLQAGTAFQFLTITSLHDRERQQHLMVKYSKGGISVVVFQLK